MDAEKIAREALQLPLAERAELAHKLLLSLEGLTAAEHDQLWLDEAVRRAAEINSGAVQMVAAEEVSHRARALLK
jgi:hypothetical protein